MFEGENFREFAVLWLFTKVFSAKFGGMASFGAAKVNNLRKFSPRNRTFHQFAEVSPLKVSWYTV